MSLGLIATCTAVITFTACMIYSAVRDMLTMTVSDRVMIVLLLAFPILAPLAGWTLESMLYALAAALVVFFASVTLFAFGCIGGGDGKMLTTAVLWIGAQNSLDFIVATALLGGIYAILIKEMRTMPFLAAWRSGRMKGPEAGMPYVVAIASATLVVMPKTIWMSNFF